MRLLIHERAYRRNEAAIAAHGPAVEPLLLTDAGEVTLNGAALSLEDARPEAAWANSDVFFGGGMRAFASATLKSPDLKWVQSGAAGYDNAIFGQFVQKGAALTTSHGQAVGIADYVLWGVLDVYQDGPARRADQTTHTWKRLPYRELEGSRWVVLGFGAIGHGVAVRAKAFGAHVTGVRRSGGSDPAADRMVTPAQFLDVIADADVVALCAPATPETRHIANAEAFGRMKPGSVLVNVGRGALVDEPALLAALAAGAPSHAVLDVFEVEPQPADSPFWDHPQVTMTPHAAGMSSGNAPRNDALFLENLGRYLAGQPLENVADPKDVLGG
ncbi:MAG: D-2-hydroxyacid dehydrogenase [Alphaproteobacteria bacterium]|nr:D-2-hydroxyacid dehydrogenase [Alphaproteobacteria bacterium]MBU1514196.1 D-2-hydroxyacid dehydrogenase [Alphaproteobacteria bacterium]MBU2096155.1 D-2-hydroxyacid dehydrogenase [Alphaproteobacteria bacterium]MBU2151109.1 D-2-hydroxyacid dehydrogenase [Alphaproteobacteria bacterium]MBU2307232.1 D-2-hydroxyacid dehydrogenase [Alphaproteobacteria bacterium]